MFRQMCAVIQHHLVSAGFTRLGKGARCAPPFHPPGHDAT